MGKNLDVNIDAEDFLDSFRPELPPPAALSGTKEKTVTGENRQDQPSPAEERRGTGNGKGRRNAKSPEDEYLELFIRNAATSARSGKLTYIRQEYHDRIMKIIQVIGKNGLSLSGYIDHVLTHHFEQYGEAVKKLYKENYEDVF